MLIKAKQNLAIAGFVSARRSRVLSNYRNT